jgi:plasmid maintenance system killer protein
LHVDFADDSLRRLVIEPGFCPAGWDAAESRHLRLVIQCAQAAKVPGDLHAMRVLRIQPCNGDPSAASSVHLSARRCLLLTYVRGGDGQSAVKLSVKSLAVLSKETEKSQ